MASEPPEEECFSKIKFKLNSGHEMPAVGLGTYKIRQEDKIMRTLDCALEAGYRMFDTAAIYGNETYLKAAFKTLLPKYGLDRTDIFVTTKLSPSDFGGRDIVKPTFDKTLENLGFNYVDLNLIHIPGSTRMRTEDPHNKETRAKIWDNIVQLYDEGRAYSIGVSNFNIPLLEELVSNHSIVPAVNQVEWHPYYFQKDLLEYCKEKDIVLQAYSSFGAISSTNHVLLEDPVVTKIAKKINRTSAQVLLMWALQQDVAVIPKSTNPAHIQENISLDFRLTNKDLKAINDAGENHMLKFGWNPHVIP